MTMRIDGTAGITFPDGTVQSTAATGGGSVTSVTAVAPLASTGGATPAISLSGIVPAANGGTGAASLTGLLYGNGAAPATAATGGQIAAILGSVPVNASNNVAGGTANQIPFQSAANTTSFISAPGAAGQSLQWNGTNFVWGATGGSGTVTSLSVASTNGFTGTVANPTTTPVITLATSVTGVLKGDGTAISAASASDITTLLGTTPVNAATNLAGGAANQLVVQSAAGTTSFVTAPTTAGTALEWDGSNFVWNTAGNGTVTTMSVVSANGMAGTVANPTTTPAITLTTTVSGVLKGDGTAFSAASASDIATLLGTTPVNTATNIAGGTAGQVLVQTGVGTTGFANTTGTGVIVQATSPTLVTPNLGTPSAVVLTNATGTATALNIGGNAGTATSLTGGTAGSVPYQTAANTTAMLPIGATGEVLTVSAGGLPVWSTVGAATTATNLAGGAANQFPYQTAPGTTTFLAAPTVTGSVLSYNGTSPVWSTTPIGQTTNALTAGTGLDTTPTTTTFNGSAAVTVKLADTAVTPGTYGSATTIPVITVDQQGRITAASSTTTVAVSYQGTWDASTNTPTLADGTGTQGQYYVCNVAGTVNLGSGSLTFNVGDWVIYNGTVWELVNNSQTTSVANFTITGIGANELLIGGGTSPISGLGHGTAGQVLTSNGAGNAPVWAAAGGTGTVTSVAVSGGTTGLTTSGGPITAAGTITLAGTLNVANGGTGATTLTGYVKGSGTSAMTASATIPNTDITGLGTMSTQDANAVAVTGGTINGTVVGGTTPAAITGTTITATQFVGVSGGTF